MLSLTVLGGFLFLSYNAFPLGLLTDELVKISNIRGETGNFNHPWVMIHVIRLVCAALNLDAPQAVAVAGRSVTALAGLAALVAFYAGLRRAVARWPAAGAVLLCLLSPLVIVQAHHIKEDTWLLAGLVLVLAAVRPAFEAPSVRRSALLGAALAVAVSSKAVGLFMLPVLLVVAATAPAGRRRAALLALLIAVPVAALGVALINLPILLGAAEALRSFRGEVAHSLEGHWDGIQYPMFWYLRGDIWNAFRWLLPPAAIGFAVLVAGRRPLTLPDRLFLVFAAVYYAVIEATPLIAAPQTERYLHPLVLPLGYFAARGLEAVARWGAEMPRRGIVTAVVLLAVGVDAGRQAHIAFRAYRSDTRAVAARILAPYGEKVRYGSFTSLTHIIQPTLIDLPLPPEVDLVAASSFIYDRFAVAVTLGAQRPEAYRRHALFETLFQLPYCEIRPSQVAFGLANPTIRIVAVPHPGETPAAARARLPSDPSCIQAPAMRADGAGLP